MTRRARLTHLTIDVGKFSGCVLPRGIEPVVVDIPIESPEPEPEPAPQPPQTPQDELPVATPDEIRTDACQIALDAMESAASDGEYGEVARLGMTIVALLGVCPKN